MREIKFRAWDKELEFFQDDENVFINQNGGVYREDEGDWCKDAYVIQMYIGIKDKNGKEIYEGDIIRENEYFHADYKVVYDEGYAMFTGIKTGDRDGNTLEFPQLSESGIVVGNIYENKELLSKD